MIRILKPSIDDAMFEGNPILRGVIDPRDLNKLRIDSFYQREYLASSARRNIMRALEQKVRLPDLELAMRGSNWEAASEGPIEEVVRLLDPVFIVDGQQRRGSMVDYLAKFPKAEIRQGVVVHFGSTMAWERERFQALNLYRNKVSGAVMLRNMRDRCKAIATLYGLSTSDRDFPLYERVSWQQTATAQHLMTATAFASHTMHLHSHLAPVRNSAATNIQITGDRVVSRIGLQVFRKNTQEFWEAIDSIWGIKALTKKGAVWMSGGFLYAIADTFWRHTDFWRDDIEFVLPYEIKRKLKLLNVNDPEIVRLSGSVGLGRMHLAQIIVGWINSGKRTNHLHLRTIEDEISRMSDAEWDNVVPMAASPVE
jgi:hypothetical protein